MGVDPDPDEIYTKRKARVSNLPNGSCHIKCEISERWLG